LSAYRLYAVYRLFTVLSYRLVYAAFTPDRTSPIFFDKRDLEFALVGTLSYRSRIRPRKITQGNYS